MAAKEPYEDHKFNFTDYEYFKVSKFDLYEFEILADEIIECAKNKRSIEKEKVDRFFFLLKKEKTEPEIKTVLSDTEISDGIQKVLIFMASQRRYNDYDFKIELKKEPTDMKVELDGKRQIISSYGDFTDMLIAVVEQLRVVEFQNNEEWVGNKDFCMKEGFKEFMKYYWWFMGPEQQKKYMISYKFIALSALIAEKVWGFGISEAKKMTMHRYHLHGLYALKKYNIDVKKLLDTTPNQW